MNDFDRMYLCDELLARKFSGAKRAIEICTVQDYNFSFTPEEEEKLTAQWSGIIRKAIANGTEITQIQLCTVPISQKMKAYLAETDAHFKRFGEKFYVISQADFEMISDGWPLTRQIWNIDDKKVIFADFTENGKMPGEEEPTDAKSKQKAINISKKSLELALKPEEFLRVH
jgi:hypothetical protein